MESVWKVIITVKERFRTIGTIIVEWDSSGISNILFPLRTEKGADGRSAFEKQTGRKPNTGYCLRMPPTNLCSKGFWYFQCKTSMTS